VKASPQGYNRILSDLHRQLRAYDERAALLNAYPEVDDAAKKRLRTITKQITR